MFTCAGCSSQLFPSSAKFDSGTGWPSFFDAVPGAVLLLPDNSIPFMTRVEVIAGSSDNPGAAQPLRRCCFGFRVKREITETPNPAAAMSFCLGGLFWLPGFARNPIPCSCRACLWFAVCGVVWRWPTLPHHEHCIAHYLSLGPARQQTYMESTVTCSCCLVLQDYRHV